jgi:hypothetical protein
MPLELDPFKPGENKGKDDSPLRKWMTKKEAMLRMDIGKTLFADYKKIYGLKTSKIGHKERVYEDDLHEFYMKYRK